MLGKTDKMNQLTKEQQDQIDAIISQSNLPENPSPYTSGDRISLIDCIEVEELLLANFNKFHTSPIGRESSSLLYIIADNHSEKIYDERYYDVLRELDPQDEPKPWTDYAKSIGAMLSAEMRGTTLCIRYKTAQQEERTTEIPLSLLRAKN